jgi:hypothetical protein
LGQKNEKTELASILAFDEVDEIVEKVGFVDIVFDRILRELFRIQNEYFGESTFFPAVSENENWIFPCI